MGLHVPLNIGCEERIDYGRSEKEKVIIIDNRVSKKHKTQDSKKNILFLENWKKHQENYKDHGKRQ